MEPAASQPRLEVTPEDIAEVVSMWTGVPVTSIAGEEAERLLQMEEALHERIVGQDEAIKAVWQGGAPRPRRPARTPKRPIGSFLFLGPTGVGKTELAKALAEFMFGSEEALLQLDMSEFMERHTVARLVGAPPGYVGYDEAGQLTEAHPPPAHTASSASTRSRRRIPRRSTCSCRSWRMATSPTPGATRSTSATPS